MKKIKHKRTIQTILNNQIELTKYALASENKQLKKYKEAEKIFDQLINNSLDKNILAGSFFHKGEILFLKKNFILAIKVFIKALENNSEHKKAKEYLYFLKKKQNVTNVKGLKILLISPPREVLQRADFPPLGLGFLAGGVKKDGHSVRVLDAATFSWEALAVAIEYDKPDVIGITCWTIERGQAYRVAQIARQTIPNSIIIIGGPHASAFPDHMFKKTPADYVVIGEGEETLSELLSAILYRKEISNIKGLAYQISNEIKITERREFIKDLNKFPMLLHDEFDYSLYNGSYDTKRKAAAIFTSRGCPFNCIFCSSTVYWGNRYRRRSVENVIEEIKKLYNEHSIRALLFFDDNLLIDRERCVDLCNVLIEIDLDLIWVAEGTVKVDEELLKLMKRAGCYRIDFGVESGSPKILKNINKSFKVEDIRKTFELCKKVGIKPNAYLILGSPGETKETVFETVQLMKDIQPGEQNLRPGLWVLPNTKLYDMSIKEGIISNKSWLESDKTFMYTAEHSEDELEDLVAFFNSEMRNAMLEDKEKQ